MTTSTNTEPPIKASKLSPRMLKAINLIMEGKMQHEVANELGVSRQTINGWKNHHALFKATLEALIADVEVDLRSSAPLKHAFVQAQLLKLTADGPHESRLKAIQYFFDRFAEPHAGTSLDRSPLLSEGNHLLLGTLNSRTRPRHTEN